MIDCVKEESSAYFVVERGRQSTVRNWNSKKRKLIRNWKSIKSMKSIENYGIPKVILLEAQNT